MIVLAQGQNPDLLAAARQSRGTPHIDVSNEETARMQVRGPGSYLVAACIGIELLLFLWLCSLGPEGFMEFIWTPDTPGYVRVAWDLVDTFTLVSSPRTLGYPLFLAPAYLIGGQDYWMYLAIAFQLILNVVFTLGCWRLLQRLVPAAGVGLRVIATLFFFWAGLGMAVYLLTDFMASLLFGVFLYGLLFWRTPSGVALAGASLALATLTRPTFTFFPFLLPIAAYLVGRFTSKVPWYHVLAFTAASVAATGVSVMYQYRNYRYVGPSPILVGAVADTLYYTAGRDAAAAGDYEAHKKEFEGQVEKRGGREYATLTPAERDKYAQQILREELFSNPGPIIVIWIRNCIKYVFAPVESIVLRVTKFYASEQTYLTYVRPIVGLACLPIWFFSLMPPIGSPARWKMYYLLILALLVYVVGLSAISAGSGERIRFPVLAFMLPVMAWNVHRVHGYLLDLTSKVSRNRVLGA